MLELEQAALDFLALFDADQPDLPEILRRLSPDARYLNHAKHGRPHTGREEIERELSGQFSRYGDCRCRIDSVASNDRGQVFIERYDTVRMRTDGRFVSILVCAVFDYDAEGLISFWREYWDMGDVLGQMTSSPVLVGE